MKIKVKKTIIFNESELIVIHQALTRCDGNDPIDLSRPKTKTQEELKFHNLCENLSREIRKEFPHLKL